MEYNMKMKLIFQYNFPLNQLISLLKFDVTYNALVIPIEESIELIGKLSWDFNGSDLNGPTSIEESMHEWRKVCQTFSYFTSNY